jgi:DNA-binding MarR family transcriptional regulator
MAFMDPSRGDVEAMTGALFLLTAGLERARRQKKDASALSLLQVLAGRDGVRPSELADLQAVHPSLVTRQVRELEDTGYVQVAGDPADGRSWLVTLTPAGSEELRRLTEVGLDRFALFVADWSASEVQTLAALLTKLRESVAAAGERESPPAGRGDRARRAARTSHGRRRSQPDRERQP